MTQPDTLHTRLRAEIERRLKIARDAARLSGSEEWTADRLEVMVLERHTQTYAEASDEVWQRSASAYCSWCAQGLLYPCADLRSLAHRLGVNVDGQTTT